jgi:hypothetical protein
MKSKPLLCYCSSRKRVAVKGSSLFSLLSYIVFYLLGRNATICKSIRYIIIFLNLDMNFFFKTYFTEKEGKQMQVETLDWPRLPLVMYYCFTILFMHGSCKAYNYCYYYYYRVESFWGQELWWFDLYMHSIQ